MRQFQFLFGILLLLPLLSFPQNCPTDPPKNPFLADSPWPIYHRNNFAQSSTCLRGPQEGDSLAIKFRGEIKGGTSPWVYISEPYPNGDRVLYYSNSTHVFKFIDNGVKLLAIDSLRIDFDPFTSFGWNFLLAKQKIWYTYDPKYDPADDEYTKLYKLTDADTMNAYSDIVAIDTFDFGTYEVNRVQHFSLNYWGEIVFHSDNNTDSLYGTIGIISQDFQLLDTLRYPTTADEITNHNAFPIDENNSLYITTNKRLLKFDWDGTALSLAWEAPYDFVADGPVGTFAEGSGTTPTLLGWGAGNDKLVVMSDGHAKNNLVAFWRELPDGWTGVPGMDIHFADSIRLPAAQTFSNQFQSIENSPTAFGYDIGIAQFNGFLGYDCENLKGVQKVSWDTASNEFKIAWVNRQVNMNGVLTYSQGSNIVYGSGKEATCNYYYYGLDWETGEVVFRQLLGPEGTFLNDPFYDAGNNHVIDEEGNIYFAGGASIVKMEIVERAPVDTMTTHLISTLLPEIRIFPNPTHQVFTIEGVEVIECMSLWDMQGKEWPLTTWGEGRYSMGEAPDGIYVLKIGTGTETFTHKMIQCRRQ
ncbi:MAG: T9SS type A sorting domain-containing protein [Bacteroidota bacterium]